MIPPKTTELGDATRVTHLARVRRLACVLQAPEARRGVNSSQVADAWISPLTNLQPPSPSGGKHVRAAIAAHLGLGRGPVGRLLLRETPYPSRHPNLRGEATSVAGGEQALRARARPADAAAEEAERRRVAGPSICCRGEGAARDRRTDPWLTRRACARHRRRRLQLASPEGVGVPRLPDQSLQPSQPRPCSARTQHTCRSTSSGRAAVCCNSVGSALAEKQGCRILAEPRDARCGRSNATAAAHGPRRAISCSHVRPRS